MRRKPKSVIETQVTELEKPEQSLETTPNGQGVDDSQILLKIIPEYERLNSQKNNLKKSTDKLNQQIRELFEKLKIDTFNACGIIATLSKQENITFDEDILLAIVKQLNMTDMIKTREYVDMNSLEAFLYDPNVPVEVKAKFSDAQIMTVNCQLRVKQENKSKSRNT